MLGYGFTGACLVTASQVLEIKDGEFSWSKDAPSPTLEGINLVARRGELTGIVGRVGAGKVCVFLMMSHFGIEHHYRSRVSFRRSSETCAGLRAR
jgi:ABC-type bacteriocin/lantibiotic exporter with double-glycine peptidase domain